MLAARRSVGRQFVLITPGSRAEISLAPDVRVKEYVLRALAPLESLLTLH